jgi:hypothetical protein
MHAEYSSLYVGILNTMLECSFCLPYIQTADIRTIPPGHVDVPAATLLFCVVGETLQVAGLGRVDPRRVAQASFTTVPVRLGQVVDLYTRLKGIHSSLFSYVAC